MCSLLFLDALACNSIKQRLLACISSKAKPHNAVMCLTCTHFRHVMVFRIILRMKALTAC